MRRRSGYSLIEMLTVIAAGAVVLGLVTGLLALVMHTQRSGTEGVHRGAVLGRLADQFRRDARAATAVQTSADQGAVARWQFELGAEGRATYTREANALLRTEQAGETVSRRESFVLPPEWSVTIRVDDATEPAIATLLVSRPAGSHASAQPPGGPEPQTTAVLRVEAAVSKDHRFVRSRHAAEEEPHE